MNEKEHHDKEDSSEADKRKQIFEEKKRYVRLLSRKDLKRGVHPGLDRHHDSPAE